MRVQNVVINLLLTLAVFGVFAIVTLLLASISPFSSSALLTGAGTPLIGIYALISQSSIGNAISSRSSNFFRTILSPLRHPDDESATDKNTSPPLLGEAYPTTLAESDYEQR